MKKCEWPISVEPSPSTNSEPGVRARPARVTVSREPAAISLRMWTSCAQSPVFHHSATESRSRSARSWWASSAQVAAKPITPVGRQRSIASSTPAPACRESRAISAWVLSARLTAIRVAACGAGSALSIRSEPCGRGSERR